MPIFNKIELEMEGLCMLETELYKDNRGYLFESWNKKEFENLGIHCNFVQDKVSFSKKGVLRGMHYQFPRPQAKFVRVLKGEIFDVVVDMRFNSPSFGKWFGVILSEENKLGLFIPENFAHGFLALSEEVIFFYKTSDFFFPEYDRGFKFDDEQIAIDWHLNSIEELFISNKDKNLPSFDKTIKTLMESDQKNV